MSTADLSTRAARFFLLAEQASRCHWWAYNLFWEASASFAPEPEAHLPGLVAAVSKELEPDSLEDLACYPFPVQLSPEAVPWHDALVATWKIHRASRDPERRSPARRALVRLDGCGMPDGMQRPSRLPEWLAEARQIAGADGNPPRTYKKLEALAALAAWHPAPGVSTSPETLRDWIAFWQQRRQSGDPLLTGIAARALLNLPETDLQATSMVPVPAGQLLRELAAAIPVAAERKGQSWERDYLFLLDWQPGENSRLPAAGVAEVARAWLDITRHGQWDCRQRAWEQLIRWERTKSLTAWGIDLLPYLVPVVKDGKDIASLWAVSHWMPVTQTPAKAGTGSDFALLRELEADWQQHRQTEDWGKRRLGWWGSIRLYQAGLASERPQAFLKTYLSTVAQEPVADVLFVLAQWTPGPGAPPAVHRKWQRGWQRRLQDEQESLQEMAALAFVRQVLEQMVERSAGDVLRRAALEVWRARRKTAAVTDRFGGITSRFHEVRAHLAAGGVPDFEKEPVPPAQRQYPRLALPPGHIAGGEWKIENGKLRMENGKGRSPACP